MSPADLYRRAAAQGGRRALKYSAVSVISVVVTQTLLLSFHSLLGWEPVTANVLAVSLASVPAFALNRSWVWGKTGPSHFRRELLPFWGFALAGLALSTGIVHLVVGVWSSPLAVNVANISAFGFLWVAKYLLLDAVLFGTDDREPVARVPIVEPVA